MRHKTWLILGTLIAGCSGPEISRDYDPKHDFSNLKTWSFAPVPPQADGAKDPLAASSLAMERIQRSIDRELRLKGFVPVDSKTADFWVQYYAVQEQRIRVDPGYDWGHDDVSSYAAGTIIIDIVNPKDKRLIWRGTASDVIDPDLTPTEREERIQDAVHQILEEFPPQKK